jgi:pimeloyl-ACP methyl ester carboxylesterase
VTRTIDVPVDGGTLRVAVHGPASGRPVVLAVHGITGSHVSWRAVARELGDEVTMLAVDLRGRGASTASAPHGIGQHVDDLLQVLDHLEVVRPLLLGHSMGAYVVSALAARRPERASAVVLVDGGLPLPMPEGADPDAVLDATLGPAIARLRETYESPEAYRDFFRAHPAFACRPDAWSPDVEAYVDYDLVDGRSRVSEGAVRADGRDLLVDESVRTAASRLAVPTLLLRAPRGLLDQPEPLVPADAAAEWAAATPGAVVEEVEDTNHYLITLGAREAAFVSVRVTEMAAAGTV